MRQARKMMYLTAILMVSLSLAITESSAFVSDSKSDSNVIVDPKLIANISNGLANFPGFNTPPSGRFTLPYI